MKKLFAATLLLSLIASPADAMVRPMFNVINDPIVNNADRYFHYESGGGQTANNLGNAIGLVSTYGIAANMYVTMTVAPGPTAASSTTFTLWKNGIPTALTCTVAGTATSCTDTTHQVAFSPADRLTWETSPTGTPSSSQFTLTSTQQSINPGEITIAGGTGTGQSFNTTQQSFAQFYGSPVNTTSEALAQVVMPVSGTIDQWYIAANSALGNGYNITLYKNGAPTVFSMNLTLPVSGNDLINSVSFVAGDTISMVAVPLQAPSPSTSRNFSWSFRFRPTIDGESPIWGREGVLVNNGTRYASLHGSATQTTNETLVRAPAPASFTWKNLYFRISTAPGASKSRAVISRRNGANGNLTVTLSGAAQTVNSDLTHSDAVATGDLIDFFNTPTGTPAAVTYANWSSIAYIPPYVPAALVPSKFRINGGWLNIKGGNTAIR